MMRRTIEFRILGPMELWINGNPVDPGPAKQRTVLAVMLASPGQPVTVEALVDRVWDEEPPDQVRNTIYTYISRLRAVFRECSTNPLVRADGGYVLDVADETVDLHRFQRLVDRARATAATDRRALLRAALDQWRGTPLAGLAGAWAERVRHGLEQRRVNAAAEWAEIELRLGTPETVVDTLHALLASHPLAEVLSGHLIRALHRAGRSAEAMEHYVAARRRIMAEFGVEPGPALLAAYREVTSAATISPQPTWRGLRPHLSRLIGRDDEVAGLSRLLEAERLVTVVGAGGCGKSALALHVAARYARRGRSPGVALALATVTSAEQAVHTLAALLGADDNSKPALVAIERILATCPHLLVLDNCEHLATDLAELVTGLLQTCPYLRILATSRQPLSVPEETILALEPLPVPPRSGDPGESVLCVPAVELFVERLRQAAPSVVVADAAIDHVAELCRRLDGLPLALELVAARARTFPLGELVERVSQDLTLLFRTSSGAEARHATLDATLDWSFQMLAADQRLLFARMSVFAGGFTIADTEAVCGFAPLDPAKVPALLAVLVDRSLVQPYDVDGARRYRLLNVIRTFARARLADLGELTDTACHHLGWRLTIARTIDELPRYQQRVLRWQAMDADAANLRQCLEFGLDTDRDTGHDTDCGLDAAEIIAKSFEFWLVNRGYLAEGRQWLQRAMTQRELTTRPDTHALLRFHHALLVKMSGDNMLGVTLMDPVVSDLAGRRPREHLEAQACVLSARMTALNPSALTELEPILTAALASPEDDDVLTIVNAAGTVCNIWGQYERTLELNAAYDRRGVELAPSSMAAKLAVKVISTLGIGDLPAARTQIDSLLALLDSITHAAEHSAPRRAIALGYLVDDEPVKARRYLEKALTSLHTAHPPLSSRFVLLQVLLAEAQRRCGDVETATGTLRSALTAAISTDFQQSFPGALCAALLAADLGDTESSRRLVTEWDSVRRAHSLPVPVGFATAASTLGLDPAPPSEPAGRWNRATFTACVDSARDWCARSSHRRHHLG
jgi:predicted ATPase/DNA-binding SARP family transcriptional activator